MPSPQPVPFGLALLLALAACTPSGNDMNAVASTSAHGGDASTYQKNPAPREKYRITMVIKDAPGPFASMKALAQYDVVNKECLSPPKNNPGGRTAPVPTEDLEIPLERISDNEYAATLYADQMLDEDYTGRGVCHWKLIQFRVHMKATGADGETLFIPSIPDEKLIPERGETVYFNKISYPRAGEMDNYPDTGLADRGRFGPSIKDDDLFTVTFTPAKEGSP